MKYERHLQTTVEREGKQGHILFMRMASKGKKAHAQLQT